MFAFQSSEHKAFGFTMAYKNQNTGNQTSPLAGMNFSKSVDVYSKNGILKTTLVAEYKTGYIRNGAGAIVRNITAMVYNGSLPGPTFHVYPGDRFELYLVNHLNEATNMHWHGAHVSPAGISDNVLLSVAPGKTQHYIVDIPKNEPPGVEWYHSHIHQLSYGQVSSGMSGIFIVEGIEKLLPKPLQHVTQHYFWMRDFPFDQLFMATHNMGNSSHQLSNTATGAEWLTTNGQVNPTFNIKPGETQLWRFANIGSENYAVIQWPGHKFHVIEQDGNPVWKVNDTNTLFMPSGTRFDVLVTATGSSSGSIPIRLDPKSAYTEPRDYDNNVANINIQGDQKDAKPVNISYSNMSLALNNSNYYDQKDLSLAKIANHRVLNWSSDDTHWVYKINNKTFDHNRVDIKTKLGTVEEWKLRNLDTKESGNDHPFHIHVNDFQVISVNGKPYHANGYQDTVLIPAAGEVVIRIPFVDFVGKSVFHCHLMFHGDYGMMGIFEVVK
jgi:FtsP/CotA-like multicopper oxidase with cupredoxin domain